MPVSGTLPVLVSVKTWVGSLEQVVPGQLRVWDNVAGGTGHDVGVRVAVNTGAAPVPLRVTGEPATGKLPLMLAVPVAGPLAVGWNTTLIWQVPPAGSVGGAVGQLPPAAPVGRENGPVKTTTIPVRATLPVLCRVRVSEPLVVPGVTLP